MSLARICLIGRLSKRSVLLIAFQFLYSGRKAIPFGAGAISSVSLPFSIQFAYSASAALLCAAGVASFGVAGLRDSSNMASCCAVSTASERLRFYSGVGRA